eukprot:5994313-Pleurochrysis_carterae.AAC.2
MSAKVREGSSRGGRGEPGERKDAGGRRYREMVQHATPVRSSPKSREVAIGSRRRYAGNKAGVQARLAPWTCLHRAGACAARESTMRRDAPSLVVLSLTQPAGVELGAGYESMGARRQLAGGQIRKDWGRDPACKTKIGRASTGR